MMLYLFLTLFALIGILMGIKLYGMGAIKQIQSGMFFGAALGCILIMVIR